MQDTIVSALTLDLWVVWLEAQLKFTINPVWIPLVGFLVPCVPGARAVMQAVLPVERSWMLCFTQNLVPCCLLASQASVVKGNPLPVTPVDLEYQSV